MCSSRTEGAGAGEISLFLFNLITMLEIPVLIIGAGPAGLSTALHLLQHDAAWQSRVLLLDRSAHPRHKLCGGGVTRFGLQLLEDLGLPSPLPIPHAIVRDARFVYRQRVVHVRGNPEIAIFHRQEFDHYLAETARERGLTIHENERVLHLERQHNGIRVTTDKNSYLAEIVVGADGSKGVTRNMLTTKKSQARVARLLESVHPVGDRTPQFDEQYALFDFTPVHDHVQGYVWDFPAFVDSRPHHNRGIYDSRMAPSRPKAGLKNTLDQNLDQMGSDTKTARIEGHPIHWFSPSTVMSDERLLLVGDAAGAEPLFGEGIAPALGYGKTAAKTIHLSFIQQDFSFNSYKRRVLFSRLGFYMMLRWYIAWWSYRLSGQTWFMHIMWTIGRGLAALKRGK